MPGDLTLIIVIFSIISSCLSQEPVRTPKFPEVFQTQIEGTFIQGNGVVGVDVSMYFDRPRNRAALFVTREGSTMKFIYNFDDDESISIDGNSCDSDKIPDEQGFFPFQVVNGQKKMAEAAEALFFTKSTLDTQSLAPGEIPTLIYRTNVEIPQYGQKNCDLIHVFSKPDFELSTCKEGEYCDSTIISLSVKCRNEENSMVVDHVYRFSQFRSQIEDESVFLPSPGIHCDMKNTKDIPQLPPYFSFAFDITEMRKGSQSVETVYNHHKEMWYDSEYKIIRIDEFGANGLLYSTRILDQNARMLFTIIATNPTCSVGPISEGVQLDEVTLLPKSFFKQNKTEVYVGKRNVHGLDYDVWSSMWRDSDSAARVVEEVYYLQISPDKDIVTKNTQPYPQLSHIDMYIYEENEESGSYELGLLKHFSINNYKSKPKEWAAFDVATCFTKKDTKAFSMKVEGPQMVKGSQSYREVLEQLYNKIIKATGVSVVRISELRGIFDGLTLLEIKGAILDNSDPDVWPKGSKEPGMDETFRLIKKAVSNKQISGSFLDENNKKLTVKVTSIEEIQDPPDPQSNCYSGSSLAGASLALLIIGVAFGVAGYYVFLKKRRPANIHMKMSNIKE